LAGVLSRTEAGPTKVSALPFYLDAVITATKGLKRERGCARRMVFGQPAHGLRDGVSFFLSGPLAATGRDGDQGFAALLGGEVAGIHG
jgi:hypothetical protein